jgi:hypothetical protein
MLGATHRVPSRLARDRVSSASSILPLAALRSALARTSASRGLSPCATYKPGDRSTQTNQGYPWDGYLSQGRLNINRRPGLSYNTPTSSSQVRSQSSSTITLVLRALYTWIYNEDFSHIVKLTITLSEYKEKKNLKLQRG